MSPFDYKVYCKLVIATFIKATDKLGLHCQDMDLERVYEAVESVYSDAADEVQKELVAQGMDALDVCSSCEVLANEVVEAVVKVVIA